MGVSEFKVEEFLKQHGIKPSYQRMKIYDYLIEYKSHPTVDEIYQALIDEIPTLSKTTVYNTLKLFLYKEIIQLITIEESENRYDADVSVHGHFKCLGCGKIYDVWLDMTNMKLEGLDEFSINESHIYLKGTCNKCSINLKTN
jgi:Fe2+ or Zn2+ uptake regulation protein